MSQPPPTADATPSDCERIIIVGAGGFGREALQWARHAWPEHVSKIAGFLSDDPNKLTGHATSLPILGSPADFVPQLSDGLVLAIGIPHVRRQVAEALGAKAARFLTLIHPTAIVAETARIGTGTIVCPYAIVSDAVRLGRFVLVNYHAALGHDASAGDFSVLSPNASLGGAASVGKDVFIGLSASIAPKQSVGCRSQVSANSTVRFKIPEDSLVCGVPGKAFRLLRIS